jgi:hypothetical protein
MIRSTSSAAPYVPVTPTRKQMPVVHDQQVVPWIGVESPTQHLIQHDLALFRANVSRGPYPK